MAKNGYKMIDAELHVMEPVDLWENYIADEFKDRAPKRMSEGQWDIRTLVEGEMMNDMAASGPYSVSGRNKACLLYTSPSPRDATLSRMPSSA